jgi:hypothetical protein
VRMLVLQSLERGTMIIQLVGEFSGNGLTVGLDELNSPSRGCQVPDKGQIIELD